jgi:small subunit ribosomal protein S16
MDSRSPRDGKAIEELGYYDPMVKETDARAVLKADRIDYWLGVGAQPSDNVKVLIKKYGTNGTHLEQQKAALEKLQANKPSAPPPMVVPRPKKAEEAPAEEAPADDAAPAAEETPPESPEKAAEAGGESSGE